MIIKKTYYNDYEANKKKKENGMFQMLLRIQTVKGYTAVEALKKGIKGESKKE